MEIQIICDAGVCRVYEFYEQGERMVGLREAKIVGETPEEVIEELELMLANVKKAVKP